jgi:hypothetical protein
MTFSDHLYSCGSVFVRDDRERAIGAVFTRDDQFEAHCKRVGRLGAFATFGQAETAIRNKVLEMAAEKASRKQAARAEARKQARA